jgi:hypothetical protein
MLSKDLANCRFRIFDGEQLYSEDKTGGQPIRLGTVYGLKHRVQTRPDGSIRYSVKLWEQAKPEPKVWTFEATEPAARPPMRGSALLLAHNTDVTFGNIRVIPVRPDSPINESTK